MAACPCNERLFSHGGKITGSISKKLSYLVAGENMGPAKREKATGFKVPIISENDLMNLLVAPTEETSAEAGSGPAGAAVGTQGSLFA